MNCVNSMITENTLITQLEMIKGIYENKEWLEQIIQDHKKAKNKQIFILLINITLEYPDIKDHIINELQLSEKSVDYIIFKGIEYRTFNFSKVGLCDDGMKYIVELSKSSPYTEKLFLDSNFITDVGIKQVSPSLINLTNLKNLNLNENDLGENGVKVFSETMSYLKNLEVLSLNRTLINANSMQYLSNQLQFTPKLKELSLSMNEIGDVGMKYLSENIHFIALEDIKLTCI